MEFSARTREENLNKMKSETFDLLIIGGGITGAAVLRDAASRGLKCAMVEKNDFAYGTSSRSSKLVHGGLRYLQNFEFHLVFEALSERSHLLKTNSHLVRPLPFYFPIYDGDKPTKNLLGLGLFLYDLLALFRTPEYHQRFSKDGLLEEVPFLNSSGLQGGFRYADASMWDDLMVPETARAAQKVGGISANYVEAIDPIWSDGKTGARNLSSSDFEKHRLRLQGMVCKKTLPWEKEESSFKVRAKQVVFCGGPWTDKLGNTLQKDWKSRLKPSRGIHLVFDYQKIPVPGAVVMNTGKDGRIAFVIPRKDYGEGVTIVGTTDSPAPENPDSPLVSKEEVEYLLSLLYQYFPSLHLKSEDIHSAYSGIRPLVSPDEDSSLQKISREHEIWESLGGAVFVGGGKYTTHRQMAEDIVDFCIRSYQKVGAYSTRPGKPNTKSTLKFSEKKLNLDLNQTFLEMYGSEVEKMVAWQLGSPHSQAFPLIKEQLRFHQQQTMVMKLEDFYFRRVPLFLAKKDHGLEWVEELAQEWKNGMQGFAINDEKQALELKQRIESELSWKKQF